MHKADNEQCNCNLNKLKIVVHMSFEFSIDCLRFIKDELRRQFEWSWGNFRKSQNDKEAERWQDQLAFNFGEYCEISRQIRDREQEAFEDVA